MHHCLIAGDLDGAEANVSSMISYYSFYLLPSYVNKINKSINESLHRGLYVKLSTQRYVCMTLSTCVALTVVPVQHVVQHY